MKHDATKKFRLSGQGKFTVTKLELELFFFPLQWLVESTTDPIPLS